MLPLLLILFVDATIVANTGVAATSVVNNVGVATIGVHIVVAATSCC